MAKVRIKLTIRDEPYVVDEAELPGLRAQGFVAEGAQPVPVSVPEQEAAEAPAQKPAKAPKTDPAA